MNFWAVFLAFSILWEWPNNINILFCFISLPSNEPQFKLGRAKNYLAKNYPLMLPSYLYSSPFCLNVFLFILLGITYCVCTHVTTVALICWNRTPHRWYRLSNYTSNDTSEILNATPSFPRLWCNLCYRMARRGKYLKVDIRQDIVVLYITAFISFLTKLNFQIIQVL